MKPEVERDARNPRYDERFTASAREAGDSDQHNTSNDERANNKNCRPLRGLDGFGHALLGFRASRSTPGYTLSPAFAGWNNEVNAEANLHLRFL